MHHSVRRFGRLLGVALLAAAGTPLTGASVFSRAAENAAHDYRQAFAELARLPDEDADLPGAEDPLPADSVAAPLVARLRPALECLRAGAARGQCDWESDLRRKGGAAEFPHLAKSRDLARRAIFRARYYWQANRREAAVEDLHAVLVLARHVGDEGRTGLVGLTERYKIEQAVVDVLSPWLTDDAVARSLEGLIRLPLQPEDNLPKRGLLLERETIPPWTRRLVTASDLTLEEKNWRDQFFGQLLADHGAEWILQQLDDTEKHYADVGELLDLPPDQFGSRLREYLARLDGSGNPFSQVAVVQCPGIPGAYFQSRKLHAEWTILRAAAVALQRGPAALADIRDPYGEGPLEYAPSGDGFTIRSALLVDGKPVELSFASSSNANQRRKVP